ncbi:MAG: rod shape-determining protein [Clostridiales bacterium]|nr:rod shape-determining protein [Clostridiales bacterium]
MFEYALGMDLGTSSVQIYRPGKGIVVQEPSVVAVRRHGGSVVCAGSEAQRLLGREPDGLAAVHPLRAGVISDCGMAGRMVQDFVRQCGKRHFSRMNLLVCVPPMISELEERAVIDVGLQAGANRVYLAEEPAAAAAGAGIQPDSAKGVLLVDIGAGTTDIAVLSCGAVVTSRSIRTAGNRMDEEIQDYLKKEKQLEIGIRTAEHIKRTIGCAVPREERQELTVCGRSMETGLPASVTLSDAELAETLSGCVDMIIRAVCSVVASVPPELVGDLTENGVVLTGGGAQLYGMEQRFAQQTGLQTRTADDPQTCVARGTARWLGQLHTMQEGTINLARRRLGIA